MKKMIKKSERGLTFSLDEGAVPIGAKYHYLVDVQKKEINIIFDENGALKVSKKRSGSHLKPLFDIRSKEVRELVSTAEFLEIEVLEDKIVVYTRKREAAKSNLIRFFDKHIRLEQILGSYTGKIEIPMQMVSGESYQYSLDEIFPEIFNTSGKVFSTKSSDIKRVYDVVSLFSGAGLFDYAFRKDRFRFVYANDFEKDVIETYKANLGDHIVCKDIRTVTREEIPNCDLTIGGPCCQAYSICNQRDSNTEKGEAKRLLIDDYARLVKSNVWVIENVPTILTKNDGYYFERLCSMLSDYEITATVVVDSEVGGYSKRQRAIIIGSKIGKIELPQVKVVTPKTVRDALSKVDATWYNYEDCTKPSKDVQHRMSFVPQGGNWKDIPPEYNNYGPSTQSNIMRRLKWDEPSITLSNFRKSNIIHPEENRTLTVSEAAAISGLDKKFKFLGSLSAKQQMVANGVTMAIGKLVSDTVLKALDNFYGVPKLV